jgi:hypothetical protein
LIVSRGCLFVLLKKGFPLMRETLYIWAMLG